MFNRYSNQGEPIKSNSTSWKRLELDSRSISFPDSAAIAHHTFGRRKHGQADGSSMSQDLSLSSPSRDLAGRLKRRTSESQLRIPVLTKAMIKMHDVFEKFCSHLSNLDGQSACVLLDSVDIMAPEPNSPTKYTSPSRSPIASWFTSNSNTSQLNDSQMFEFEKACAPLIFFAGVEAIYYSCSHLQHSQVQPALTLIKAYSKTIDELRHVREILCDPFAYTTTKEVSPSSYTTKAATLSVSIEALMSICECRCKLIEQHVILCSSDFDAEKVAPTFHNILHSLPKRSARSLPIVESIKREVEGWCSLMAAFCSFRKYRFMKTIVNLQRINSQGMKMIQNPRTPLEKWMSAIYHSFISMLPIFFASVHSDVLSRYEYKESSFCATAGENSRQGTNLGIESKVEEALQLFGTPCAIAMVTSRSVSNYGSLTFGFDAVPSKGRNIPDHSDALSAYPVLYMKTTGDSSLSGKILGENSWPYMSWDNIVAFLLSSDDDSVRLDWSRIDESTIVLASRLDHLVWLVAIKKTNDDGLWNRRKNDDEHARKEKEAFIDLKNSLRLRNVFKSSLSDDIDPIFGFRFLESENIDHLLESFKRMFGLRSPTRHQRTQLRHESGTGTWSTAIPSHFAFFLGGHLLDSMGNIKS